MRVSRTFGTTLRSAPAEATGAGYQLLLRAGLVRPLAPGIFSYLPLGLRTRRKIEDIVRGELRAIGAQEVELPLIQPEELWQRSGQGPVGGVELVKFTDRADRPLTLGFSHEAAALHVAAGEIRSHRQLPILLFRIGPTFRDELRPRGGLIRARQFTLADSYSLDRDEEGRDATYEKHIDVFTRVTTRLGLEDMAVALSDTGSEAEAAQHELVWMTPTGESRVTRCGDCGHAAIHDVARFRKPEPESEEPGPLERVATPGTDTIEALAEYLGVPSARTAKAVFYRVVSPFDPAAPPIMAVVRGDMEVSESKLRDAIGAIELDTPEPEEIRAAGAEPGYASPVGLDEASMTVVVDDLVARSPNLVCGANEEGYHLRNVNAGRDFAPTVVADIALAPEGCACPDCGSRMETSRGVEVASAHKFTRELGARMDLTYQDEDGEARSPLIGSYGIGIDRLLACLAERHRDEDGLMLPPLVAPYQVSLVSVGVDEAVVRLADELYNGLLRSGIEVLYDDRDVRAGVKFKDADLIGMPVRVTIGSRGASDGTVEIKLRQRDEPSTVSLASAVDVVRDVVVGLLGSASVAT